MKNKYVEKLKTLVSSILRGEDVEVVLFGSRARNDNDPRSDIDIGIMPGRHFNPRKLSLLKDKVDDLNIPYKVDIVNFSETSEDFRAQAMKGAIQWKI